MSTREIVTLGTASQVPTRRRNHHGCLLRWDKEDLLLDPGEGTQRQMIYADTPPTRIGKILITHFHGDHCLGLAGMVQRLSLDRVPQPVEVFFPASGHVYFDRLRQASIYHAAATIVPRPIHAPGTVHDGSDFRLVTHRLDHPVDTFGYRLEEPDGRSMLPERLDALGIRGPDVGRLQRAGQLEVGGRVVPLDEVSVEKPGQRFAFVMDTRECDGAWALAEGADLLVIESTYLSTEEKEARQNGHLTARQAARIAAESGVRRLVLTHFSQRYHTVDPFLEEARELHGDVVAAIDGRRVALPPRREP